MNRAFPILVLLSAFSAGAIDSVPVCVSRPALQLKKVEPFACVYSGNIKRPDPTQGGEAREIPFRYFYSTKAGRAAPLVLVYPSLVNQLPVLEEIVGRELAYAGYHALVVDLVEDIAELDRRPEQINDFFLRSNWSSEMLLDEALKWPEVAGENVHAMGISLGGIRATVAYGRDFRIDKLALYVAGGDLPEIMAHSQVKLVLRYKEHWMEKLGLTSNAQFSDYLRKVLFVDPLETPRLRSGKNVFMVMGKSDEKVPYENQKELYEAFGEPESHTLPFAHRLTGTRAIYRFDEVIRFFEKE